MIKARNVVKTLLPQSAADKIASIEYQIKNRTLFISDAQRFNRSYSKSPSKTNHKTQLTTRLVFHAHSLEKGLSHKDIRLGFGKQALQKLAIVMREYSQSNYDLSDKAYVNAISILHAYYILHKDSSYSLEYFNSLFDKNLLKNIKFNKSQIGGVLSTRFAPKTSQDSRDFKKIFLNRTSVREFSKSNLDMKKITQAIEISMKSPSICNRQASRIYVIKDPIIIGKALKIQGGMAGYKTPPVLIAITSDLHTLIDHTERNQVYIDGGIFSMSLLLNLEYEDVAACPLNAMFNSKRDNDMRRLLSVPDNEVFIMFIACGNFNKVNKAPKSFRYASSDITTILE